MENIPLDADNEGKLGLGGDVKGALLLSLARKTDLLALGIAVLLDVLLSTLEDGVALSLVGLLIMYVSDVFATTKHSTRSRDIRLGISPERWLTRASSPVVAG